jgi:hypothetical protein
MRLPFFIDLPTDNPHMVEQAKRDIASCASEEGYNFAGEWTVKPVNDAGVTMYRVEAVYDR